MTNSMKHLKVGDHIYYENSFLQCFYAEVVRIHWPDGSPDPTIICRRGGWPFEFIFNQEGYVKVVFLQRPERPRHGLQGPA